MYGYKILLKIASPTSEIPEDFNEKKTDIDNAVEQFNEKYIGRKEMTILELTKGYIVIILKTKELLKNPTREFSVFSKILKHDYDWGKFTSESFRLFDASILEEPNVMLKSESKYTLSTISELDSIDEVKRFKGELTLLLRAADVRIMELNK